MSDAVQQAEAELEVAKLSQAYDEAVEAYREKQTDQRKAKKDDLANQLVAARQASRVQREAEAASLDNGTARPGSISGSSEVK